MKADSCPFPSILGGLLASLWMGRRPFGTLPASSYIRALTFRLLP